MTVRTQADEYFGLIVKLVGEFRVSTPEGTDEHLASGVERAVTMIRGQADAGRKLMFIGNGASAAISLLIGRK